VKLRLRLAAYVVAVHMLAAGVAFPLLLHRGVWLLAAEALLAISLMFGLALVRALFRSLELIQDGAQFLEEGDFTARLREVGQPESDQLVRVYNQMVDHLREERTRLEEQHHFLSQIMQESPSGIVVLDFDGAIELANPTAERLLGPTPCRGRKLSALSSPAAQALEALAPGEAQMVPLPDGRRVKCRRGTFQDRGFPRGFFLVEELTEELRRVEKAAYEKLIKMMSHEVNNSVAAAGSLLTSCLNYTPLLPEEHRADMETALRVVIARTEQLGALMRSFAEVVRLPPPQPRPCDVEDLVRRVAVLMRAESEKRRITWRWEVEAPLGFLSMDPAQMEQVFLNVVKNAAEAIGEGGTITARLGRAPRPFVAIEDTGPGIAAEARAHLFTPFFSTKEKGQGIGLMLIQQILVQHRFEYALEAPPGGPTRFTVFF
jgi:two-component system, NtrC family, nitrogen regulation sensor histidine kinase NtrY